MYSKLLVGLMCGLLGMSAWLGTVPAVPASSTPLPPLTIGVDLPASGITAGDGLPARNAALLAVEQINRAGGVRVGRQRYQLALDLRDATVGTTISPDRAVANVQAFIADPTVVAMLGPFGYGASLTALPPANAAGLPQIGLANITAMLTSPEAIAQGAGRPPDRPVTYFRLSPTYVLEGQAAADYLFDRLRARTLYLADDATLYGQDLTAAVGRRFTSRGGAVLGQEHFAARLPDYAPLLAQLASRPPSALFYGGIERTSVARLRRQMVAAGFAVPLVTGGVIPDPFQLNIAPPLTPRPNPFAGGHGLATDSFLLQAGAAANGTYAAVAWENPAARAGARSFLAAYRARFHSEAGLYSAPAYDAVNLIADALRRAGRVDRAALRVPRPQS